jgi:hypothetical protein
MSCGFFKGIKMKALKKVMPAVIGALFLATGAQAATIDFTGLNGTTDPIIGDVSFWAGDPTLLHDTFVADFVTPGNDYLMSGLADGTGMSPASGYDTFIGVSRTAADLFGSVSFDIASDYIIPTSTTLLVEAYLAGTLVGSDSVVVLLGDSSYHTLALNISGGFDSLRIFDDINTSALGEAFHIDNFNYTNHVPPCTGPGCNPNPTPEPSVLLLLGAGLAGLVYSKRRKSV